VPHRAVVNAAKSRISLVYFWVPLTTIDIVPSPELVDEENPCKYKPFNFEAMTKTKQMYFLNTLDHFLRNE
jgi:isopenicillin N synthase-like dioxygenase